MLPLLCICESLEGISSETQPLVAHSYPLCLWCGASNPFFPSSARLSSVSRTFSALFRIAFPPPPTLLSRWMLWGIFSFLVRRFTKNISMKAKSRVGWKESNVVLRVGGGDGKLSCAFLASSWLLYRVLSTVWCIVIWIFFSFTRLSVVGLVFGCEWDSLVLCCCCMVYLRESNAIRMRSEEKSHQNVDFVCLKCSFGCSFFAAAS